MFLRTCASCFCAGRPKLTAWIIPFERKNYGREKCPSLDSVSLPLSNCLFVCCWVFSCICTSASNFLQTSTQTTNYFDLPFLLIIFSPPVSTILSPPPDVLKKMCPGALKHAARIHTVGTASILTEFSKIINYVKLYRVNHGQTKLL